MADESSNVLNRLAEAFAPTAEESPERAAMAEESISSASAAAKDEESEAVKKRQKLNQYFDQLLQGAPIAGGGKKESRKPKLVSGPTGEAIYEEEGPNLKPVNQYDMIAASPALDAADLATPRINPRHKTVQENTIAAEEARRSAQGDLDEGRAMEDQIQGASQWDPAQQGQGPLRPGSVQYPIESPMRPVQDQRKVQDQDILKDYEARMREAWAEEKRKKEVYQKFEEEELKKTEDNARLQAATAEAKNRGVQQAAMDSSSLIEQQEIERQSEAKRMTDEQDEEFRPHFQKVMQDGDFGAKLRLMFGLFLGAASQSLTGAAKNPVEEFIDSWDDKMLAALKLKKEQKLAAQKAIREQATHELNVWKARAADKNAKAQIQLALDKMAIEMNQLRAAQDSANEGVFGRRISAAAVNKLDSDDRKRLISLPDGSYTTATSSEGLSETRKDIDGVMNALSSVDQLVQVVGEDAWVFPKTEKAADVKLIKDTLIGNLRIALTGPGPLTAEERIFVKDTIGDLGGMFTIPSFQRATVARMQKVLKKTIMHQYNTRAGIPRSMLMEMYPEMQSDPIMQKWAGNVGAGSVLSPTATQSKYQGTNVEVRAARNELKKPNITPERREALLKFLEKSE